MGYTPPDQSSLPAPNRCACSSLLRLLMAALPSTTVRPTLAASSHGSSKSSAPTFTSRRRPTAIGSHALLRLLKGANTATPSPSPSPFWLVARRQHGID